MLYFIRTLAPFLAVGIAAFGFCSTPSIGAEISFALSDAQELRERNGLPNVLAKLQAGEEVRIAYLGGSITAQPGWRVKTTAWIQSLFPQTKVVEIYAALGGTGSELGVFRIDREVIPHSPDLLFVEFAVNDSGVAPEHIQKTMEGIVRKIWRANPRTDICFVYTLKQDMLEDMQAGKFPASASAMERVADYYGIPSIHMGFKTAALEREGKLLFQGPKPAFPADGASVSERIVFSPDGVHPYPSSGHVLYFEAIERSMKAIAEVSDNPGDHSLGDPLWKDNWEDATMVSLDQAELSSGWKRLDLNEDELARRFQPTLSALYRADKPGETISFKFKGTDARVLDLMGPNCGGVLVQVDDLPATRHLRFDSYCVSYRIGALPVATALPNEIHQITLTIDGESPDKAAILSKRNNTIDDPQRFEGVTWYPSAILLRGSVVESSSGNANEVSHKRPMDFRQTLARCWQTRD